MLKLLNSVRNSMLPHHWSPRTVETYIQRIRWLDRLRVKDIARTNQRITVRDTEPNRNRHTILPSTLLAPLEPHRARVTALDTSDIANNIGVYLPIAIAIKIKTPTAKSAGVTSSSSKRQDDQMPGGHVATHSLPCTG